MAVIFMEVLNGRGVFGGISFGNISFYNDKVKRTIKRKIAYDEAKEFERFKGAKSIAENDLQALYEEMLPNLGEEDASIFLIQKTILHDEMLNKTVEEYIKNKKYTAEYAVRCSFDKYIDIFNKLKDEYFRERSADIKDICERIINILTGVERSRMNYTEPVIVAAEDLVPSQTITLDRNMVLGFVTAKGSPTSHTAILARTLNIPAIVGLDNQLLKEYNGCFAAVDGFNGKLYINPDDNILNQLKEKKSEYDKHKILLKNLIGKDNVTKDGKRIDIFSNIAIADEADIVLENDCSGIGLFRSEIIFLANKNIPSEDEQFYVYKTVAEKMKGKKVVIRTFDLGADKIPKYLKMDKEDNPSLGCRAIRFCLKNKNFFKTQLKAIYRASAFGQVEIMFPMIASVEEMEEITEILDEVKSELRKNNILFNENIHIGAMIETPAAAIICDKLCKYVSFFSIGTNDLTQYLLAIDRQNSNLEKFYNPYHESVFRLIGHVVDVAHKNNVSVCICGELASDINVVEKFLRMGVDSLSVSPYTVLQIREKVRELDLSD